MGKLAENEKVKLRATYLNNIGVGLIVAGFLLPFIAIVQRLPAVSDAVAGGHISVAGVEQSVLVLVAMWMAWHGAKRMRKAAEEELSKLQD
jgi:hypothetical protein